MQTTYKVGDKVRILNAKKIQFGERYWNDGDISEIKRLLDDGRPCLSRNTKELDDRGLPLWSTELQYIEKVEESDAKMTRFKVGDKVRIIQQSDDDYTVNAVVGSIAEIVGGFDGEHYTIIYESSRNGYGSRGYITRNSIELVSPKQMKNQRIYTLEQKVEAMQAEIDSLKAAQKPKSILSGEGTLIFDGKPIAKVSGISYKTMTPNEQRKAIIDEAKAFVEELTAYINPKSRNYNPNHPKYGEIKKPTSFFLLEAHFVVKSDKNEVTCVLKGGYIFEDVKSKAIAKCNPSDVFNEHIGKAIALGRALGLDVSKFEKAAQPSEVVVGQVVDTYLSNGTHHETFKVARIDGEELFENYDDTCYTPFQPEYGDKIINDTEAQY